MEFFTKNKNAILACLVFLATVFLFLAVVNVTYDFSPIPAKLETERYIPDSAFNPENGKILLFFASLTIPVILLILSVWEIAPIKKFSGFVFAGLAVVQVILLLVIIPVMFKADYVDGLVNHPVIGGLITEEKAKETVKVTPAIGAILSTVFTVLAGAFAAFCTVTSKE